MFSDSTARFFPILLCLLVPQKSLVIQVFLTTLLLLIFSFNARSQLRFFWGFSVALGALFCVGVAVRFFAFDQRIFRDLLELGRFFPLFILLLTADYWSKFNLLDLKKALMVFISINFIVCLLQVLDVNLSWLYDLYNSEFHLQNALGISSRALGLAPGPGQNASISFAVYVVMLSLFFIEKDGEKSALYGTILSLLCIILSQSQTGFIATLGVSVVALSIFSFKLAGRKKRLAQLTLLLGVFSSGYLLYILQTRFSYLASLFTQGLKRSSFVRREEKWQLLMEKSFEQPIQMGFGWGKEYFGESSGAMDNEWLYIFLVYGAVFFLLTFFLLTYFIVRYFLNIILSWRPLNALEFSLWLMCVGGAVIGLASAFFTQLNILIFIFILWRLSSGASSPRRPFSKSWSLR